jgi:trimethylamine-N-oxide reductase (cytochrome c)
MEVILLAMQGLGKPGRHQLMMASGGMPKSLLTPMLNKAFRGWEPLKGLPRQIIPKTLIPEAILNPPVSWYGTTQAWEKAENQFVKYDYPAEGCSEIHMIWTDSPCWIACWNGGNYMIEAFRSPKIEFVLAQHPWLENDCLFADIILPVNTKLEENDIGSDMMGEQCKSVFLEEQCVEPLGESKSDYEIVCMIAEKLGVLEEYTEGRSVEEWIKYGFETCGVKDYISYEDFAKKGYYCTPTDPDWEKYPAGLIGFYQDPEKHPLATPSGKIECYAQNLAKHFPDDDERPPVPHWIEKGPSHDERISGERAGKYPLLLVSNHPRWRVHVQFDDTSWLREIAHCKVRGLDGYLYEPVWINPVDAAARGIKDGDIVNLYNERGGCLGGAVISERIMPGAILQDHGARYDPIVTGELDRGGSNNTICPTKTTSRNASGEVTSGFLVEVEKTDIGKLMEAHPEAFQRDYTPEYGLLFGAWVEDRK